LTPFTKILLSWYDRTHRLLPWRKTRDPYKIWISEIILQQTRIAQGTDYYLQFIKRFSTVKDLASAKEEEVLMLWQGLGYYSRARNMHHAAKEIMKDHGGKFPSDYENIRSLKGIGDYTAAAIASISFGLPYPVVDGNVLRFFSRYFGIAVPVNKAEGKKAVLETAIRNIDKKNPGKFNQAIMEFGALQCVPGSPDCGSCPLGKRCFAYSNHKVKELPLKPKTGRMKTRHFNYLIMTWPDPSKKDTMILLRKREENDIWKNLYDFPLIETPKPVSLAVLSSSEEWKKIVTDSRAKVFSRSEIYRHVLSHQTILARFIIIHLMKKPKTKFISVRVGQEHRYPVSRLIAKFGLNFLERIMKDQTQ
jgi:A/G-specific adenine glycosylase